MSGGQGRLKPSSGSFFVASMPSLLPQAISLVAWSSTSDGPFVKMLPRCGSVLATLFFPLAPQQVRAQEAFQESRESPVGREHHANGRVRRTTLFPVELCRAAEARACTAVWAVR